MKIYVADVSWRLDLSKSVVKAIREILALLEEVENILCSIWTMF